MPTGALYGARVANEPLHVSYNYGANAVDVMNNTGKTVDELSAEINVLDFDLKSVLKKTISVHDIASKETKEVFNLPTGLNLSKTYFLDLKLFNQQHENVSNNFYVLSTEYDSLDVKKSTWFVTPQSHYADLTMLQQLPTVKLQTSETASTHNGKTMIHVKVKNPTSHLAFMVYLDLKKGDSNESVVPVFWHRQLFFPFAGRRENSFRLVSYAGY